MKSVPRKLLIKISEAMFNHILSCCEKYDDDISRELLKLFSTHPEEIATVIVTTTHAVLANRNNLEALVKEVERVDKTSIEAIAKKIEMYIS